MSQLQTWFGPRGPVHRRRLASRACAALDAGGRPSRRASASGTSWTPRRGTVPSSASRGTSCLGGRCPYRALVMTARSCASSAAVSALRGRRRGPHRRSSPPGWPRQRSIVRAEIPMTRTRRLEPRARRLRLGKSREDHRSFSSSVPSPSPSHSRFTFFLSTSSAAASASAFSFRASSRSSARMRLVVASEARPSSAKARRHCSYSASSSPSRSSSSVSSAPVSRPALARIRIFSSIDHSRGLSLGRHHREATRVLQPPRERLLAETGLQATAAAR